MITPLLSLIAGVLLSACVTSTYPPVRHDDSVRLRGADERVLPVRVVYRPGVSPAAVVVLSHGTFSSGRRYDPVADFWAENGYVVLLPDHRDAEFAEVPRNVSDMHDIVDSRVVEMSLIADQLNVIEQSIPALKNRLVGRPLVAAGHSVGTQVALQVTGMQVRDPDTGAVSAYDETRFVASVLLSDPGKMALMPPDTWMGSVRPVFLVTGPDDYGLMGDGRQSLGTEREVLSPRSSDSAVGYLLLIQGLDHQFGGLIHKSVDAAPDTEALRLFNEYSLAFLDGYLRNDKRAQEKLRAGALSNRASLQVEQVSN